MIKINTQKRNRILPEVIILLIIFLSLNFIYSNTINITKTMTLTETEVSQKVVKIKCAEMSCSSCKKHITQSINKLKGIEQVDVNLDTKIITVIVNDLNTTDQDVLNAVIEAGYEAELI